MRNVWKGLIVGGLTGVGAGILLDTFGDASKKAAALGEHVLDRAPEAGQLVHAVADRAGAWLHDTDVPEHLRTVAHRMKDSDVHDRISKVGHDVASSAREAIGT